MSTDKTVRLTDVSGSQAVSLIDKNLRATISTYSNEYLQYPKLLTNSHSLKNLRDHPNRISQLQFENQMLRQQISILRKQVKEQQQHKSNEVIELEQQVNKLKKLIQKSYYSLKILQKQNISFREQTQRSRQVHKKLEDRNMYLQSKVNQLCSYLKGVKGSHEQEMKLVWQRVSHLQRNLQSVVQLIEQDKRQQKYYKTQLRGSRADSSSSRSLRYY